MKGSNTGSHAIKHLFPGSLCNKMVLTLRILSLFDQGPMLANNRDNENSQCTDKIVSVKRVDNV